ncbi:hypothetical protein CR513_20137 [Mucuna pruriens]|uniref:Uncharacterized protein n=1 Tax=Mucuna pruriens TaxID=157652 RepID=A0A371H2U6_MUCPR|nr:hypothetical protein CR513_20137 [Mucuna pruriens]
MLAAAFTWLFPFLGMDFGSAKQILLYKLCTTIKSFLEETLVAIPDSVMDSPVAEPQCGRGDLFANIHSLLPPPYRTREEDAI